MNNQIKKNLKSVGFNLPSEVKSVGSYLPYLLDKKTLYISGQLPISNGKVIFKGKINNNKKDYGYKASQLCAVNIIGQLNSFLKGNFNKLSKCINLSGFVNCQNNFSQHSYVINGASDLLLNVLKNKGAHTRFAVGVNSLPLNASVEIDAIFSIK